MTMLRAVLLVLFLVALLISSVESWNTVVYYDTAAHSLVDNVATLNAEEDSLTLAAPRNRNSQRKPDINDKEMSEAVQTIINSIVAQGGKQAPFSEKALLRRIQYTGVGAINGTLCFYGCENFVQKASELTGKQEEVCTCDWKDGDFVMLFEPFPMDTPNGWPDKCPTLQQYNAGDKKVIEQANNGLLACRTKGQCVCVPQLKKKLSYKPRGRKLKKDYTVVESLVGFVSVAYETYQMLPPQAAAKVSSLMRGIRRNKRELERIARKYRLKKTKNATDTLKELPADVRKKFNSRAGVVRRSGRLINKIIKEYTGKRNH